MDGIINVLKPVGMTSTDVVRRIKRLTNTAKVGHIGTLDPGAAGVLPVCLGKATRLVEYHTNQQKIYRAEITLGIETDTQDAYGQVIQRLRPAALTEEQFKAMLNHFMGQVEQIPPMYSAVRKNGRRLYELARQGIEVEREKRIVEITRLQMIEWSQEDYPRALFDIECSKGTYIRTLCHDIGRSLGCGAHMSFLLRLKAGSFKIDESYTLEEITDALAKNDYSPILGIDWGLELPKVELPPVRLNAYKNGLSTDARIIQGEPAEDGQSVSVYCNDTFMGIGIWRDGSLLPAKVIG